MKLLIFTYRRLAALSCDAGSVCISVPGREERGREREGEKKRDVTFLSSPGMFCADWLKSVQPDRAGHRVMQAVQGRFSRSQAGAGMLFQTLTGLSTARDSESCCIRGQQFCRWKHMTPSS